MIKIIKTKIFNSVMVIFFLGIITLVVLLFRGSILTFCERYKDKGIWELFSSVASIIAVIFAAITTLQARRTIEVTNREFISQKTPVLLYSDIESCQLDITTQKGEYRFYLPFTNHGRTIALLREIKSSDSDIQYNLSPPISIGVGQSTNICIIHSQHNIDNLLNKFVGKQVGEYVNSVWKINVKKSEIGDNKIYEMSRVIKLNLLYWNIHNDCYKTEVEFEICLYYNIHWYVKCVINSESNSDYPVENKKMPKKIINYSSL